MENLARHLAAHPVAVGAGALCMPNAAGVVDIADDVRGVFGCKPDGWIYRQALHVKKQDLSN